MTCKPTIYKSIPPFLTMRARQPKGTRVTITQLIDPVNGQVVFATYKGDMREVFEKERPVGVFEARGGVWKKITAKGERIIDIPTPAIGLAKEIKQVGGRALLVGGGVRDALLGRECKDYDIEIYGVELSKIESILEKINPDHMDTVGRSFGVIKAKFGEDEFDISIPRTESKNGNGHRGFEIKGDPGLTPKEAARRRDLTINSLAQDPLTGEIIDSFGGHKDLAKGVLRATDPKTFIDDPLRVLRVAQFAARFGFKVNDETLKLCRQITKEDEFKELPTARITEEWKKLLLKSRRPSVGLEVALQTGALKVLHPQITALEGTPQEKEWHPEGDVWIHTKMTTDVAASIVAREKLEGDDALVIMLASLLHDVGKPDVTENKDGRWISHGHEKAGVLTAKKFLSKMEFGKEIESRVLPLIQEHMFLAMNKEHIMEKKLSDATINRLARRLGPASIEELVLVMEADVKGRGTTNAWREDGAVFLLQRAKELNVGHEKPDPLIKGRHLIEHFNAKPGHQFGKILNEVYEAQLDGVVNNFEDAINMSGAILEQVSRDLAERI